MRTARFRERLFAFLVDLFLVAVIGHLLGWPVLIWAVLGIGYTALSLLIFRGRTPGKILLRLRVVGQRSERGGLRLWQVLLRPVLYIVELALLCGGFLVALAARDRLALHDMLLDTRVVKVTRG